MARTKNMTVGKPFPLIFAFFIPILFSFVCQQLYAIVDTIIVGKGIGDLALAAVGATGAIDFFIFGFIMGVGTGASVLMAQAFGADDMKRFRKTITMGVYSSGTIALVVAALSIITLEPVLVLLNTDPVLIPDAKLYFDIILYGVPLIMLYNFLWAILNAVGDSKTPFIAVIISTVVNICLDILFIMGFGMGVEGAAIGTLIAQLVASAYCFKQVYKLPFTHLSKEDWEMDFGLIKEEFRIGLPVGLMNSVTAIGSLLLQYFVNKFGVNFTASYSACIRITNFTMQPCAAIGAAMSTFAGQNRGAGKIDRIRQGLLSSSAIAITIAVIMGGAIFFFPRQIVSMMVTSEEIIALSVQYLRICGAMMVVISMLFLVRDTLQGMGSTFVPMLSGALELATRIVAVFLFVQPYGYKGIAIAEVSAWATAFLLNGIFLMFFLRKEEKRLSGQIPNF
ncbi:MAG: MATE family efflux transporter [Pseudobutyrivibrio sp.]|nr:MATE family efflux transporter [Pseudobutyrivibrio sp.]